MGTHSEAAKVLVSLENCESALLLAVPSGDAMKAEQLLSEAGVQALSLPDQFEDESVGATITYWFAC